MQQQEYTQNSINDEYTAAATQIDMYCMETIDGLGYNGKGGGIR